MSESLSVEKAIEQLIQPAVQLDSVLSLREQELLKELERVRGERRRLAAILKVADPERATAKPTPKGGRRNWGERTVPYAIAEHVVEHVRAIIEEHLSEEEFTGSDVLRHFDDGSQGGEHSQKDKINKALHRLRERGAVRMVGAKRGRGGANAYIATERISLAPGANGQT